MPKRFQFSLATIFIVTLVFGLWFGLAPSVRAYAAIRGLSNKDVSVGGGFFGLDIRISGESATYLESLGKDANPWLQDALDDKQRFAAAHVLLVNINLSQQVSTDSHWNRMQATLHADGSTDLHVSQIPKLVQHWQKVLSDGRNK